MDRFNIATILFTYSFSTHSTKSYSWATVGWVLKELKAVFNSNNDLNLLISIELYKIK